MNNSQLDAGIPVLTEIITAVESADVASVALEDAVPLAIITLEAAAPETRLLSESELDEGNWERLERELRERILNQVMERMDHMLEQHVRDSLANVLQNAVEELASGLKHSLHLTVRNAVTNAVSEEIEKLQSLKK